jgi:hypothetical protein
VLPPTAGATVQWQRQLGISDETACLLHKLRRAMVNPEREARNDKVEVDETLPRAATRPA